MARASGRSCKCIHKTFLFVHVESVIFTLLHRNLLKLPPQWIMQLIRGSKLSIVCAFKKMDHFDVTSPQSIERARYNDGVVQHSMSYAWRCTYSGTLTMNTTETITLPAPLGKDLLWSNSVNIAQNWVKTQCTSMHCSLSPALHLSNHTISSPSYKLAACIIKMQFHLYNYVHCMHAKTGTSSLQILGDRKYSSMKY